jgi:hypothetical protein
MADRLSAERVLFHRPKARAAAAEWEDCGGYTTLADGTARSVVVDGATEAYDALRWVGQLVRSCLGVDGRAPDLTPAGLDGWIEVMQQRWLDESPAAFASVYEERKFRTEGSFATFLGCDVRGLGGPRPTWTAASLGDAVLFHVRGARVVDQVPAMAATDFGLNPDGIFTQTAARDRMRAAIHMGRGELQVGDLLFLATDALSEWLVRRSTIDNGRCWRELAAIDHPAEFQRFIAVERNSQRMKNDDITLLRVQITRAEAGVLVVCR